MPLSQILIDGEGWKKAEGKAEKPKGVKIQAGLIMVDYRGPYDITFPSGEMFRVVALPGVWLVDKKILGFPTPDAPTTALLTTDGSTLYVGGGAQRHLWAYRVERDGTVTARDKYAPLRLKYSKQVREERGEHTIAVTSLATDRDGRIYAATEIGVQVFDPTGRLCGVMTAPVGKVGLMGFEGDKLTLWIGDTKYARKLNTQGAK
jgi:hypothetical protein